MAAEADPPPPPSSEADPLPPDNAELSTDSNDSADENADEVVQKEQILQMLPDLKAKLGMEGDEVSDSNLIKFLYWKPNEMDRIVDRIQTHVKWRKEAPYAFDTVPLLASQDAELKKILECEPIIAPEDLRAKDGSHVLIGRLRKNDMTDGRTPQDLCRMLMYTMDRVLERQSTLEHGITLFHDLKDVTKKNVHITVPKLIFSAIIGNFPIRIKAVYLLNAPKFFKLLFQTVVSLLMPKKLRVRTHFINDIEEIYKVIDQDELLEEHGGKRIHDQKEWVAKQIQREVDGTIDSLTEFINLSEKL